VRFLLISVLQLRLVVARLSCHGDSSLSGAISAVYSACAPIERSSTIRQCSAVQSADDVPVRCASACAAQKESRCRLLVTARHFTIMPHQRMYYVRQDERVLDQGARSCLHARSRLLTSDWRRASTVATAQRGWRPGRACGLGHELRNDVSERGTAYWGGTLWRS